MHVKAINNLNESEEELEKKEKEEEILPNIYHFIDNNGDIYLYTLKYKKNNNIYLRCKDRACNGKAIYKSKGEIVITEKCKVV